MIPSAELEPAGDVPALTELPEHSEAAVLDRFATIKLNGGLATTMGLQWPKSLIRCVRKIWKCRADALTRARAS